MMNFRSRYGISYILFDSAQQLLSNMSSGVGVRECSLFGVPYFPGDEML